MWHNKKMCSKYIKTTYQFCELRNFNLGFIKKDIRNILRKTLKRENPTKIEGVERYSKSTLEEFCRIVASFHI